jgi:hypothetical protein
MEGALTRTHAPPARRTFGLYGLREQAEVVRGRLEVRIKLESGTEVELIVPGSVAYDVSTQPSGAIASTDRLLG